MTNKRPINRLDSRRIPGYCVFCLDSEECYSTPKKCREAELRSKQGGDT